MDKKGNKLKNYTNISNKKKHGQRRKEDERNTRRKLRVVSIVDNQYDRARPSVWHEFCRIKAEMFCPLRLRFDTLV